jgi:hypothetical protein
MYDGDRITVGWRFGGAGIVALEVRVAQRVHEVAGRLAAGENRAQGGGSCTAPWMGVPAPW